MKITSYDLTQDKSSCAIKKSVRKDPTFKMLFQKEDKKKLSNTAPSSPLEIYSHLYRAPLMESCAEQTSMLAEKKGPLHPGVSLRAPSEDIRFLLDQTYSEIVLSQERGSTKTTLHLDPEHFKSPLWNGATITIEEFSSAPKIFNIKITASAEAIMKIESQMSQFLELFKERKLSFSINRIDTELYSPEESFRRKEGAGDEEPREQQGNK